MSRKRIWTATVAALLAVASWSVSGTFAQTSGGGGGTSGSETGSGATGESSDSGNAATDQTSGTPSSKTSQAADTQTATDQSAADDLFGEPTPSPAAEQADTATLNPQSPSQPGDTAVPPAASGQAQPESAATAPGARAQGTTQQQPLNDADARLRPLQRDPLADLQFGPATDRGLTVANIAAGSVFVDSGLRPGDVIVAVDNRPVRSEAEFAQLLGVDAGRRVPVTVLRGGRQETIFVTYPNDRMATRPDMDAGMMDRAADYQANRPVQPSSGPGFLGVAFDMQIYNAAAIRDVLPDSAAAQAGLREGDVIVSLNGQRISSPEEALDYIRAMQSGEPLEIEYTRRMPNRAQATLGARPTSGPGAVSYGPGEPVDNYRGRPADERYAPEPAPMEQGRNLPPPSSPVDQAAPYNELP